MDESHSHPRLRSSVLAFRRDQTVQFISVSDLRVKEFQATDAVIALIPLIDGTRSIAELRTAVAEFPDSANAVDACLDVLRDERLLGRGERWAGDARHSRQGLLFEEMIATFPQLPASPRALQDRLGDARVVIVGIGGVGSWVLQSLAMAGVGRLDIVDPDVVELSNLNRQPLYSTVQVGTAKIDAARDRLGDITDGIVVSGHRRSVESTSDLADLVDGADLVISCGDEPDPFALSDIVAECAQVSGIPHIVGGAYGGNLGSPGVTVVPGKTVCWSCIRDATRDDHRRLSMTTLKGRSDAGGSIAPVSGLVGNLTAWEALRVLLGLPLGLADHVRELDIMSLDWRIRRVEPAVDCARRIHADGQTALTREPSSSASESASGSVSAPG